MKFISKFMLLLFISIALLVNSLALAQSAEEKDTADDDSIPATEAPVTD